VGDTIERDAYFALADESKRMRIPFSGHLPSRYAAGVSGGTAEHRTLRQRRIPRLAHCLFDAGNGIGCVRSRSHGGCACWRSVS
jgi:hypothetical protein